jgi:hypothetical protein
VGVHSFPSSSNLSVFEPIVEVISFVPVLVSSVAKATLRFT